jgi:glucose-6-phosphate isomerase/transaldolase/glucose-6-phosphate isomerase
MPLTHHPPTFHFEARLGAYQNQVDTVLHELTEHRIIERIWERDATVWPPASTALSNPLGWLQTAHTMRDHLQGIDRFVRDVRAEGFTQVLVLGMGGASLIPAIFSQAYEAGHEALQLAVLDSTDPSTIDTYTTLFDPAQTLFVVASKSGTTVETLSLFKHFYNQVAARQQDREAGRHFVAITDPQSPLTELATQHGFREVFLADAATAGRYAALSPFGLVPAALVGVDLSRVLDHAKSMTQACEASQAVEANLGTQLGALLGTLAHAGRDKVTLVASSSLGAFGAWVEQLLAESTGKEGQGLVPILYEPLGLPQAYGNDRLFIHLALSGDDEQQNEDLLDTIAAAGQPIVHLHLNDPYELGGQFFLWEMATAVAGHYLGINPFDQPNVDATKQREQEVVTTYRETGTLPEEAPAASFDDLQLYGAVNGSSPEAVLQAFLEQGRAGDYVTFQAYLPPPITVYHTGQLNPTLTLVIRTTAEIHTVLLSMCARIRDKYGLAATFNYGPQYLHTTGQLHKGDAGRGLFIQLTADPPHDMPIPAEADALSSLISFGALQAAQALEDRRALEAAGRRTMRFHFRSHVVEQLTQLNQALL